MSESANSAGLQVRPDAPHDTTRSIAEINRSEVMALAVAELAWTEIKAMTDDNSEMQSACDVAGEAEEQAMIAIIRSVPACPDHAWMRVAHIRDPQYSDHLLSSLESTQLIDAVISARVV